MKLSDLLPPEQILVPFAADDKWAAIAAIPAALVAAGRLDASREAVAVQALTTRERSMTTGMENGVAIPHAALDDLSDVLCILAIAHDGIEFGTLDGAPGRILVGLLIPRAEKLLHIRTLAGIAKSLSDPAVREALLATSEPDAAWQAIRSAEGA